MSIAIARKRTKLALQVTTIEKLAWPERAHGPSQTAPLISIAERPNEKMRLRAVLVVSNGSWARRRSCVTSPPMEYNHSERMLAVLRVQVLDLDDEIVEVVASPIGQVQHERWRSLESLTRGAHVMAQREDAVGGVAWTRTCTRRAMSLCGMDARTATCRHCFAARRGERRHLHLVMGARGRATNRHVVIHRTTVQYEVAVDVAKYLVVIRVVVIEECVRWDEAQRLVVERDDDIHGANVLGHANTHVHAWRVLGRR